MDAAMETMGRNGLQTIRVQPRTVLLLGIVALSIATMWISVADHPLYAPDEGRYGSVSMHMADGGDWLVPEFRGRLHLTKPPLTFWAQAVCLRLLGRSEAAVRLPSLVAASLTVVLLVAVGWRMGGLLVGAVAAAILSIMPLPIVVSRLAITDPLLNLFWLATLAFGYQTTQADRPQAGRWAALMWTALALGLFTKGPVALTPLGVLVLWLALAGRRDSIRSLRMLVGLPLSIVPVAAWAALVVGRHPEALTVWYGEIVSRAVGRGAHVEPIWYYVPVFVAGLFPATAMLSIPGWHLSWSAAWGKLRAAEPAGLWALAVAVPFVMFTLVGGKLVTYLVPLCPPLALHSAIALCQWLRGETDRVAGQTRPPEVVAALTIGTALVLIAAVVAALRLDPQRLWMAAPLAVMPAASVWAWSIWKRRPALRARGLLAVWLAFVLAWAWGFHVEDVVRRPSSAAALVQRLREMTGSGQPRIVLWGFFDPTLMFYNAGETIRIDRARELPAPRAREAAHVVVLIETETWREIARKKTRTTLGYAPIGEWTRWPDKSILLLRPGESVAAMTPTRPADSF